MLHGRWDCRDCSCPHSAHSQYISTEEAGVMLYRSRGSDIVYIAAAIPTLLGSSVL